MTELEILAGLKIAYDYLVDIEENAETDQVNEFEKMEILKVEDKLDLIYSSVYKKIMKNKNESLYYKKGIKIGDSIYIDYTLQDTEYKESITYKDMDNEEKWWEDYNFLLQ